MAEMSKVRRLVNPGKRKMSALQKLFFGSKRQRAAVAKKNAGKRSHRKIKKAILTKMRVKYGKSIAKSLKGSGYQKRKRNISSIVTVYPKRNPGRKRRYKRNVAMGYKGSRGYRASKPKSNRGKKIVVINKGVKRMATKRRSVKSYRRRRRNPNYIGKALKYAKNGKYLYSNPSTRRRRSVRRNPSMRRRHHRRNPGMLGGGAVTTVLGVVGGVAVTRLLCGFLPTSLSTGIIGYAATAAIAVLQGKVVGKIAKSPTLGRDMMVGGLAYLTAKVLNDFLPSIGGYTGISGMGLIGPSNFYVPQVNAAGSMGNFLLPGAIPTAAPVVANASGVKGLRRTGRLM